MNEDHETLGQMFERLDADRAARAKAGGDYTVLLRPAAVGWIGTVDCFKGSGMQLVGPPTYWRPTAAMARAAASRKAGRWNRAADRRRCETEVGRR